jgi:hypothetical protein
LRGVRSELVWGMSSRTPTQEDGVSVANWRNPPSRSLSASKTRSRPDLAMQSISVRAVYQYFANIEAIVSASPRSCRARVKRHRSGWAVPGLPSTKLQLARLPELWAGHESRAWATRTICSALGLGLLLVKFACSMGHGLRVP